MPNTRADTYQDWVEFENALNTSASRILYTKRVGRAGYVEYASRFDTTIEFAMVETNINCISLVFYPFAGEEDWNYFFVRSVCSIIANPIVVSKRDPHSTYRAHQTLLVYKTRLTEILIRLCFLFLHFTNNSCVLTKASRKYQRSIPFVDNLKAKTKI
jgi:hypothetical protein